MIISKENNQPLVEMSQFKGFGINLVVRSDDHGRFGNKASPAHAHILDNTGKEIAKIVLTRNIPKKETDIIWYRTPCPPAGLGETVVKLANSKSLSAKRAGIDAFVWQNALSDWFNYHEN